MDDKPFIEFVKTNAVRMELETLQAIVEHLHELIAQRRSGKPPGLKRGSPIEAVHLGFESYSYGEVQRMTDKGCIIETPSGFEERIRFDKYAIRILPDSDWSWIRKNIEERHAKVKKELEDEAIAALAELDEVIRDKGKSKKRPFKVTFADGKTLEIYRGAYLHAYRIDWEHHIYGVVMSWTQKSCFVRTRFSSFDDKITFAKCSQAEIFTDSRWAAVEAELNRRDNEVALLRKAGNDAAASALVGRYEGAEVPFD